MHAHDVLRGPRGHAAQPATTARNGEARGPQLFCENSPNLTVNHSKTHGTIPTVTQFADKPSEQPVFATTTPWGTRARTGEAALAQGGYTGQTSPSPPYLQS